MKISRLFQLIRTHPAVLVAAGLVLTLVLGLAAAWRPARPVAHALLYTNSPPGPSTIIERPAIPVVTALPKPPPLPPAPAPVVIVTNPPFPGLHWHSPQPPDTNLPFLSLYAPAGRMLRCRLVNTVDSANIDTPIVALVTDDLWHDGKLVIPAGTEVHGKASVDRLRERIVASGAWTLVWQTGEELVVDEIGRAHV